jgi:hypothetical protein
MKCSVPILEMKSECVKGRLKNHLICNIQICAFVDEQCRQLDLLVVASKLQRSFTILMSLKSSPSTLLDSHHFDGLYELHDPITSSLFADSHWRRLYEVQRIRTIRIDFKRRIETDLIGQIHIGSSIQ